ncbi:MAG: adenylosuccinate synthetase, partial [Candidatus Brocadiia bacterium]
MTTTLVLGLQWGDEGKGKVVDLLAEEADVVVRFQGGANSGHTVQIEDRKFFLHCIPSGILRPEVLCLLGRGMVLDLSSVKEEIDGLKSEGVLVNGRLYISPRAHLVLPHQKLLDVAREKSAGDGKIGTTGRGIGPCYSDKASRTGLQLGEIFDPVHLRSRLEQVLPSANAHLKHIYGIDAPSPAEVSAELLALADYFRSLTGDVPRMIWDAFEADKRILFEGAQGALLDLDAGSYPFVTSSTTITAGVWSGTGFPSTLIDRTVGVLKAYTTRVGMGPFPTEIQGELAENLRKRGNEFGTTTGRPRR